MGLIFGQLFALPRCWLGGLIEEVPLSLALVPCRVRKFCICLARELGIAILINLSTVSYVDLIVSLLIIHCLGFCSRSPQNEPR